MLSSKIWALAATGIESNVRTELPWLTSREGWSRSCGTWKRHLLYERTILKNSFRQRNSLSADEIRVWTPSVKATSSKKPSRIIASKDLSYRISLLGSLGTRRYTYLAVSFPDNESCFRTRKPPLMIRVSWLHYTTISRAIEKHLEIWPRSKSKPDSQSLAGKTTARNGQEYWSTSAWQMIY